jgi:hypothetical protein
MAKASGLSRFTLTDGLLTLTIADGMAEESQDFAQRFGERVDEALTLVGQLEKIVNHLLGHLMAPHRHAIEMKPDAITVPEGIRAARDRVETDRRSRLGDSQGTKEP